MSRYDVIIIGAGTAGLTAGIYAARAGLDALILDHKSAGGQITITPDIENYPGFEKISGDDFSQRLLNQVENLGVAVKYENVTEVRDDRKVKKVTTDSGSYEAQAIIIANGISRRTLGVTGEKEFEGKGVSYCATCDGAFFKNKDVCIVGGGNSALSDAVYLSKSCNKVYLIHRRDEFKADSIMIDIAKKRSNIELIMNSKISEIRGSQTVEKIDIINVKTNENSSLEVLGVFIDIGYIPQNEMFCDLAELDGTGYIIAGEDCKTSTDGIFVAGDTRTKMLRQLVTAAADGAVSAISAANYINFHN